MDDSIGCLVSCLLPPVDWPITWKVSGAKSSESPLARLGTSPSKRKAHLVLQSSAYETSVRDPDHIRGNSDTHESGLIDHECGMTA